MFNYRAKFHKVLKCILRENQLKYRLCVKSAVVNHNSKLSNVKVDCIFFHTVCVCNFGCVLLSLFMIWYVYLLSFFVLNIISIWYLRKLLAKRLKSALLTWLFSISISLSINYIIAVLVIAITLRTLA